ncbi:MAG: PhnD/SsuA/transferrin family substrate-binding protein [Verrucomicrobia bacterium]|nr:PhnD/SsuA/transferrin family substrate-binding protein [Verrucomicrobiota bacterium]
MTDTNQPFRLAFTAGMFTEVNENDARAAMKVWIMTVAKERNIPVDADPHICPTVDGLIQLCRTNPVDGFGLLTPEYARLTNEMGFDRFAAGTQAGSIQEEYVILVRQGRGVERLEQLEGRTLNVLHSPRMSLALIWLDTLLLEARQKRAAEFFGRVSLIPKASKVALPVFFGQIDACLLTRRSLAVMGELNPQIGKQLRVLAHSPAVVPAGFAFRTDYASPFRAQILAEMAQLGESPAGQQILALTQAERLEDHPVSCLNSGLELLAKHQRLCAGINQTAAPKLTGSAGSLGKEGNPP